MVSTDYLQLLRYYKFKSLISSAAFVLFFAIVLLLPQRGVTVIFDFSEFILAAQPLYYAGGELFKHVAHVLAVFGAGFYEFNVVFLGEGFSLFPGYFSIVLHVGLCGYEYHICLGVADLSYLIYPGLDVGVAVGIGDGVGEYDAVCAFVEGLGDVAKALLAGCVPDVEGDLATVDLHAFYFEVHTDGAEVVGLEGVFAVAN
jgi:hypothetical protein